MGRKPISLIYGYEDGQETFPFSYENELAIW